MLYSELIPFFRDRLFELFHKDSLDSCRVRYHNTLSILKELRSLIEGWQNRNIKRAETLSFCIQDAIGIIKNDTVFNFSCCSKDRFISTIDQYRKNIENSSQNGKNTAISGTNLIFLLNKLISDNQGTYLDNLWEAVVRFLSQEGEIEDKDFVPQVRILDTFTTSLAREILNRGYSKREAFMLTKEYNKTDATIVSLQEFREKLSGMTLKDYTVVLQLYFRGAVDAVFSDFLREFPDDILNENAKSNPIYKKFTSGAQNRKFYVTKTQTTDSQSAIREAKRRFFGEFDIIHIGISKMSITINSKALVIEHHNSKEDFITFQPTEFVLDGQFPQNFAISNKYRKLLKDIKNNSNIENSVKIRIDGALRHLRIANADNEIEQRFINYWIALEFIFSSPLIEENTYLRLKTNLTNVLSVCYVARNVEYIEKILRDKGHLKGDEHITATNIDSIINNEEDLLLKYKLKKLKSRLFTESDRRKQYVSNHKKNLEAHLSRIYHLRNELIHEAAINQDIEDLTSNLKYYLVFLLNQLIIYFSKVPSTTSFRKVNLDEFFYDYQIMIDDISEDWSLEKLLSVPYQDELIIS